ncbi:MAG: hypothetical protein AUH92_06615 [Acidobacteria bacterium 13_1_40CM_4_69_4]|nr:MAG: hypothetical protein AUH92_06615 [Acidobacteria bacterium 13_1_40CM_4_69_4]
MADYFGWDIGGVHLKLSRLTCVGESASIRTLIVPFEIWKDPAGLTRRLREMFAEAAAEPCAGTDGRPDPAAFRSDRRRSTGTHGVTMTAELSDVFPSRAEGARSILRACADALPVPPRVVDLRGGLLSLQEALERPLDVAAANWAATARLTARLAQDAVLVDVGSTTTDIIPISGGQARPSGRTDTERLLTGELVYSGFLRTPPASLTESVPLRGGWCRVSNEHFTIMGDVHLILGSIGDRDYTCATPDGRGRSAEESMARLARLVCGDVAEIGSHALETIAVYLKDRQVDHLARAIVQVRSCQPGAPSSRAIVAGAGAFLAEAASGRAGLEVTRLAGLLPALAGRDWDRSAPTAALAVLMAEEDGASRFTR